MKNSQSGYALVELLMVILIVGLLASIAIPAFNGQRTKAKMSKVRADLQNLGKAVMLTRDSVAGYKSLGEITGRYNTAFGCTNQAAEPKTLAKTSSCWAGYIATLDALAAATGDNFDNLKKGDPWGNPYYINENELEGGTSCLLDQLGIYKPGTVTPNDVYLIPAGSQQCKGSN